MEAARTNRHARPRAREERTERHPDAVRGQRVDAVGRSMGRCAPCRSRDARRAEWTFNADESARLESGAPRWKRVAAVHGRRYRCAWTVDRDSRDYWR